MIHSHGKFIQKLEMLLVLSAEIHFLLCYRVICIAPLRWGYSEALSAWQAGERKSLQTM